MPGVGKKLISNTTYLFLDWAILTTMSFLYWIIAGKTLLPEEYGIVSTSTNLALVLGGLSLLGINSATWKLLPEYLERKEHGKVRALIKFSLKFALISNISLGVILVLLSWNIAPFLKVSPEVVWIIVVTIIFYSLAVQVGAILLGFQKMREVFIYDIYCNIVKVVASSILIFLGFRYFGALIGFLLSFLVLLFFRISSISLRGRTDGIDKKTIMFEYASPAFIAGIAWLLFQNGQYVLLTVLQSSEATGIFTVAMIITSVITTLPAIMTNALFSITSQLSVNDARKKQSYLIKLVFRYALLVSLPVAIFFVLFSKPIILIFSRPEYLQATQLFPILTLAAVIYGCGNIFLNNLYALGEPKVNRNIVIVTTATFLLLAIPLVYTYSALGLCLAYLITVTVLALLSYFFIKKRLKKVLPSKSILKLIVASLISLAVLYFLASFTEGILYGLIFSLISGLIYLSVLIPMKFYTREDVKILELFANKSPIFRKQIRQFLKIFSKFAQNFIS
jgi:O-antigen/teichoic acid export membrane protein